MKSFSDKHDTPLVVLVIPDPVQVNRKYETIYAQAGFKIPDDGLMLTRIQNRLERISGRYGAQFLDPLPQLRSLADQDLFYTNDPHLNDAGQSAIAEILAVYLRRTIGVCTP